MERTLWHHSCGTTIIRDGITKVFKTNQKASCGSGHVVQRRKAAPLPAPPGVTVVLLLVLQTWYWGITWEIKPPLGTEVTLRVVLTLKAGALVVLEAEFTWLQRAMGIGPHGVDVALLPSYLRMVDMMEGTGKRACRAGVLGDMRSLCDVTVHDADRRKILVVKLAFGERGDS